MKKLLLPSTQLDVNKLTFEPLMSRVPHVLVAVTLQRLEPRKDANKVLKVDGLEALVSLSHDVDDGVAAVVVTVLVVPLTKLKQFQKSSAKIMIMAGALV